MCYNKKKKTKEEKIMEKNRIKQAIVLLLALVLVIGGTVITPTRAEAANTVTFLHSLYTILPNGTAEYVKPEDKKTTSIHIPAAIKVNGKEYKVVSIRAGACKGCTNLIKATIGKNVKKIGKKAFYGCKRLTELSIYSMRLTTKNVAKDAFKGTGKATRWITSHLSKGKKGYAIVPKTKISQYKKVLKAGGADITKWQFFYDEMDKYDPSEWTNYDPTDPLPDLEYGIFGLNTNYLAQEINGNNFSKKKNIPVSAKILPDMHLYGDWVLEGTYCPIVHCNNCGRDFLGDMYAEHFSLMDCDMWYKLIGDSAYNAWYFYPDNDPIKVVYEFTLPEGLSYNEDSLMVFRTKSSNDVTEYCDTQVSGNKITVTIEDAKSEPFYRPFNKAVYDKLPGGYCADYDSGSKITSGMRHALGVEFGVWFNENAQSSNVITGTVTYSYKGKTKTVDLNDIVIYNN